MSICCFIKLGNCISLTQHKLLVLNDSLCTLHYLLNIIYFLLAICLALLVAYMSCIMLVLLSSLSIAYCHGHCVTANHIVFNKPAPSYICNLSLCVFLHLRWPSDCERVSHTPHLILLNIHQCSPNLVQ